MTIYLDFKIMALLNFFKKKKLGPSKADGKPEKKEKPSVKAVEEKSKKAKVTAPVIKRVGKKDFSEAAIRTLVAPHITEKATVLAGARKYVFKVKKQANKIEIKKAIRELYGVNVADVNIINIPRRPRRMGRSEGYKSGYKKAIVTLAEGEKIEVMPR